MDIKVRLFLDGRQVEPSELVIKSSNIDRIINDVVERNNNGRGSDASREYLASKAADTHGSITPFPAFHPSVTDEPPVQTL